MKKALYIHFLWAICSLGLAAGHDSLIIETLYGTATIHEPILIDLINSKAMQRLKNINQYGVEYYVKPLLYTRYQHSLGVLFLLRHFGASLDEQVFGLLHDVSHTVFSHVADYLFDSILDKYSYQDKIFDWYVEHTDLLPILKQHNMMHICSAKVREGFIMLKNDLPCVCADRLEYNLYGGYIEGLLTQEEVHRIVRSLTYKNNQWVFNDCESAVMFARVPLHLSLATWCAPWNCFVYSEAAILLKRAMEIHLITLDDLRFSTDDHIWDVLRASEDEVVQCSLRRIVDFEHSFEVGSVAVHDFNVKAKFRGIDPFIAIDNTVMRLSAYDNAFKEEYTKVRTVCAKELYIKYR